MIVTGIDDIDKKKCRIYIDGADAFVLYKGEIRKLNIIQNTEISKEQYCYIMNEILVKRARARALHILEKQERTKKQLTDKLKQSEYPEEIIENAVSFAESFHYIDDERYAVHFIRCGCKKKSKRQLMIDLQNRGIDKTIAQRAYEMVCYEIDLNEEEDSLIDKIISKRLRNIEEVTEKDIQRTYRYLLTKGFSYDSVSRHMKSVCIAWKDGRHSASD